jgi:hypothetical protein
LSVLRRGPLDGTTFLALHFNVAFRTRHVLLCRGGHRSVAVCADAVAKDLAHFFAGRLDCSRACIAPCRFGIDDYRIHHALSLVVERNDPPTVTRPAPNVFAVLSVFVDFEDWPSLDPVGMVRQNILRDCRECDSQVAIYAWEATAFPMFAKFPKLRTGFRINLAS